LWGGGGGVCGGRGANSVSPSERDAGIMRTEKLPEISSTLKRSQWNLLRGGDSSGASSISTDDIAGSKGKRKKKKMGEEGRWFFLLWPFQREVAGKRKGARGRKSTRIEVSTKRKEERLVAGERPGEEEKQDTGKKNNSPCLDLLKARGKGQGRQRGKTIRGSRREKETGNMRETSEGGGERRERGGMLYLFKN